MDRFLKRCTIGSLFLLAGLAFYVGCSEDASSVGSALFPKNIRVDSLVISADSSATYRAAITGNSSTLLLGCFQNDTARLLLQFNPHGLPDTLVVSASVNLVPRFPRYWFKDSTGTLAFTVHNITRSWDEFTITFDSTNRLYDTQVRGTYSRFVSPLDTIITFPLDTALVREWLRAGQSQGILLKPTFGCDVVYGFTSIFNIRPELVVRYHIPDSTTIGSLVFRTQQDAFVANAPQPPASSTLLFVQAGIADRGLLHFAVSETLRSASITSATLEFMRDSAMSVRNELSIDSIFVQLLVDNSTPPHGGISVLAQPIGGENSSKFSADIRSIVQQWVTGKPTYGVALRTFGEFTTLDRFAIYGAKADSVNRPRLQIVYSLLR